MPSPLPSNTVIAALPNSARRSTSRPAEASDLRQLARLDQVNQHVPLVFLQDREVPGFTDAHLVLLDGDDLLDLIERESEALCLTHEGEQVQRLAAVHPRGKVKRGRLILRSGCVPLPPAERSCRP